MPIIELQLRINAPKELVFDLSRSVDLHKVSTSETNEEAIAGKTSGLMTLNEEVTWRARHFGVYQKLTSKITQYDRPNSFTDEMLKGAFKNIKHLHLFKEENGVTILTDHFYYESPFHFLGHIADQLFLKRYMKRLLTKRNRTIKEFAETEKWKSVIIPLTKN